MRKLLKYTRLYFLIVYLNLKARAAYAANFSLGLAQSFITAASSILIVWIVLERFKDIQGWNMYEIGFMLALGRLVFALNMTFFQQVWAMDMLINAGELDRVLLMPKSSLFLFACQRFDVMWLGDLLSALLLLVYTAWKTGISWNIVNVAFLLAVILSAALIYASIVFLAGMTAFWFLRSRSLKEFILSVLFTFNPYPVGIYGKGIQFVLSFILPFAFIYYYPSLYFFHKSDLIFPAWIAFCSPAVAAVMLCLCGVMWNAGIRAYKSSGT